jgi:hypothetical protein
MASEPDDLDDLMARAEITDASHATHPRMPAILVISTERTRRVVERCRAAEAERDAARAEQMRLADRLAAASATLGQAAARRPDVGELRAILAALATDAPVMGIPITADGPDEFDALDPNDGKW